MIQDFFLSNNAFFSSRGHYYSRAIFYLRRFAIVKHQHSSVTSSESGARVSGMTQRDLFHVGYALFSNTLYQLTRNLVSFFSSLSDCHFVPIIVN